jgi:hypothetical protein
MRLKLKSVEEILAMHREKNKGTQVVFNADVPYGKVVNICTDNNQSLLMQGRYQTVMLGNGSRVDVPNDNFEYVPVLPSNCGSLVVVGISDGIKVDFDLYDGFAEYVKQSCVTHFKVSLTPFTIGENNAT